MTTKISTPAQAAGVECPKDTGKMDPHTSCKECEHHNLCWTKVLEAMGALEDG